MPICPDFKWQESESWVKIDVVLRNVNALTADITSKLCFKLSHHLFPTCFQTNLGFLEFSVVPTHTISTISSNSKNHIFNIVSQGWKLYFIHYLMSREETEV